MNAAAVLSPETLQVFESLPDPYLVLSPEFIILTASDAYLKATSRLREKLVGKHILEVFPESQAASSAIAVRNLMQSLEIVRATGKPHQMEVQECEIPSPDNPSVFVEKYWLPVNTPVLNAQGELLYIIHRVDDITEKKRTEKELQHEHQLLKGAQALGRIGSFERRLSDDKVTWSDELYRIHGLEPQSEEITMQSFLEFIHPEDRTALLGTINQAITTKKPVYITQRIIRKDGEIRFVIRSAQVKHDENGNPVKIYGTVQDITEKHQAEEELLRLKDQLAQKATDKYLKLFNSIDEGFCIVEVYFNDHQIPTDFRYLEVNPAFENQSSLKGAQGKTVRELVPGIEPLWIDKYGSVALTGEPLRFVDQVQALGKWFDLYAFRIGCPGDHHVAILFRDISERKAREEQVRCLQESLRIALEGAELGTWDLDLVNDSSSRRNFRHDQIFGYQTPQLYWNREIARRHIVAEDREVFDNAFAEAAETGMLKFEVRVHGYDGILRWMSVRGQVVFDENGKPVRAAGVNLDVTDRKNAEQQLQNFNKLLENQVAERTLALCKSNELLQTIFDTLPKSITVMEAVRDQDNQIVNFRYVLRNQVKQKGNQATEEKGQLQLEQHPGVIASGIFEWEKAVLETGEPADFEVYYNYEGVDSWLRVIIAKMGDGIVAFSEDVSARKRAERELIESKLFTEQVMEATPDYIMIFNLLENKVDFVNRGAYQQDEKRYRETMEISYDQILVRAHPGDRQALHLYINNFRTASDHEVYALDYRVVKGPEVIWYRTRGKVFKRDKNGSPTHYISVIQDISKIKQLEEENLQMRLNQQNAMLLAILDAQEAERRRISESLHNDVGQLLYATKLNLNSLATLVPKDALKPAEELLSAAITETRRVSHELVPIILQDFGLAEAFNELCMKFCNRDFKISCQVDGLPKRLESYLEVALYRISQELINNVAKHAQATEARLALSRHGSELLLEAQDNGTGFDANLVKPQGIGLRTIRDRIKLLNGSFKITRGENGKGTHVTIRIPVEQ